MSLTQMIALFGCGTSETAAHFAPECERTKGIQDPWIAGNSVDMDSATGGYLPRLAG